MPEEITKGGNPKSHDVTLSDLGIDRHQSSNWQRKAGEILKETIREPGDRDDHIQISQAGIFEKPKLNELKITLNQSSNWQRIAEIPEEIFENYIRTQKEITT